CCWSRPCSPCIRYTACPKEEVMAKRDYLVEAAKQIRMALDSEVNEDYEAAFSYYKNVDPNKDRREAVKRKTTQYLKRAEEIFITHLQDNLGKGSSHLGGYSSLRFRPIRHLSSPVEDLEMCKVVGVADKSLVKSSWESRDQPTIIPQGVPYMVKLLRYYVSEDAVYLHLEHVKGDCGTHSYIEETGCLQNTRSAASFYTKLDRLTLLSGPTRTQVKTHIHPPAPSLLEEARELLSPGEKRAPTTKGSSVGWFSSGPHDAPPNRKREDVDGFIKPERPDGEREDQIIEVDGWCHLPRFPIKSPGAADKAMQTCWGLPENEVRIWGAQILLALESLHQQGILCRDLNPRNVLLTSNGKVCLTFFSQWSEVQSEISSKSMEQMYCAPAFVAAPPSRNPLPHSAAHPRPPEHRGRFSAYRG
uniref:Ribosomal protein S6 kinase-like 1 n=1 Tax=Maylandia zebra TaxID=106582 RepID=A0A3P9BNJ1_9CICH